MELTSRNTIIFLALCVGITGIVLAVDLAIPLGVAGGVPYILVVLVALKLPGQKYTLFFALLTSLLTLAGLFMSAPGGELRKVLLNRGLALFAVWITTGISLKRKQAEIRLADSEERFHAFMDNFPFTVFIKDENLRYIYGNLEEYQISHQIIRSRYTVGRHRD